VRLLVWHDELYVVSVRLSAKFTEQQQSDDVDDQSSDADVDHAVDVLDLMCVRQSLDRLDQDREAQSYQEDGVDESSEHLGACPAERVLSRTLLRHLTNKQTSSTSSYSFICDVTERTPSQSKEI